MREPYSLGLVTPAAKRNDQMRNIVRLFPVIAATLLLPHPLAAAPQPEPVFTQGAGTGAGTAVPAPQARKTLKVHFIDVAHGDACLIQTPGGNNILIDGGYIDVANDLMRYLRGAGVKRFALVIATHPHSDHIGGLPPVLAGFPVEMVLDSGRVHPTGAYKKFMEAIKARPETKYKLARAGQVYRVDDVTITILSPREPLSNDINDCSIVCRLVYGNTSIMFTGDAGEKIEKQIIRRGGIIRSNVLKVAHHGSSSSTSALWLNAVAPQVAVISCKEREFDPSAVRKLNKRGTKLFRTDLNGTILLVSDGEKYTIKPAGEQPVQPQGYADFPVPPEHAGKIIGNVKSKVYHLPGGKYYLKTAPANRRYFATGTEAEAAGFHRSGH